MIEALAMIDDNLVSRYFVSICTDSSSQRCSTAMGRASTATCKEPDCALLNPLAMCKSLK